MTGALVLTSPIFSTESDSSLEPLHSTIVVGSVQVAATLVAALLVERAGRRLLLGVSGSLMAASLAALLVYFLFHKELDVSNSWTPARA